MAPNSINFSWIKIGSKPYWKWFLTFVGGFYAKRTMVFKKLFAKATYLSKLQSKLFKFVSPKYSVAGI